jgi:adenylate cyclase
MEDPTGALKITDVLQKLHQHNFQSSSKTTLNFGFTKSAYWVRFAFENTSQQRMENWLEIAYPILHDIEFHLIDSDGVLLQTSEWNPTPFPHPSDQEPTLRFSLPDGCW